VIPIKNLVKCAHKNLVKFYKYYNKYKPRRIYGSSLICTVKRDQEKAPIAGFKEVAFFSTHTKQHYVFYSTVIHWIYGVDSPLTCTRIEQDFI